MKIIRLSMFYKLEGFLPKKKKTSTFIETRRLHSFGCLLSVCRHLKEESLLLLLSTYLVLTSLVCIFSPSVFSHLRSPFNTVNKHIQSWFVILHLRSHFCPKCESTSAYLWKIMSNHMILNQNGLCFINAYS